MALLKRVSYCLSANIVLVTTPDLLLLRYMYQVFNSRIVNDQVLMQTNTTSQPALGIKKTRQFLVPMSSDKNELLEITELLQSVDKNISVVTQKVIQTKTLKKALMHDLLTGKKRVKVAAD